jgi:hypothetical protein
MLLEFVPVHKMEDEADNVLSSRRNNARIAPMAPRCGSPVIDGELQMPLANLLKRNSKLFGG